MFNGLQHCSNFSGGTEATTPGTVGVVTVDLPDAVGCTTDVSESRAPGPIESTPIKLNNFLTNTEPGTNVGLGDCESGTLRSASGIVEPSKRKLKPPVQPTPLNKSPEKNNAEKSAKNDGRKSLRRNGGIADQVDSEGARPSRPVVLCIGIQSAELVIFPKTISA